MIWVMRRIQESEVKYSVESHSMYEKRQVNLSMNGLHERS